MTSVSQQLADRITLPCGGTASRIIDLSNTRKLGRPITTRKPGRQLTRAEVWDCVGRFLQSGDPQDLPPAFRHEASGILTMFVNALAAGPPGPPPPGFTDPGPDASPGELMRAMIGDERADEDSGLGA